MKEKKEMKKETEKNWKKCDETYLGYVRIGEDYYVQKPDDSKFGFTLYDEETSWEGGFGIADNREIEAVDPEDVPGKEKARLSWLLEE